MHVEYTLPVREAPKDEHEGEVTRIVDEIQSDFTDEWTGNCVYRLECFSPANVGQIEEPHDGRKIRVAEALTNSRLIYIGCSQWLENRLWKHVRGKSYGAKFTQQYRPTHLTEIRCYESIEEARDQEAKVGEEYQNLDDTYVYYRHNRHERFHWD
ncbi:GIY-YIG nuclease family protein [Haloprofundus salilacus]|uniref:GIY-YIG nuclease family protein n=1 Tax=Haloprofundus salilacus TaxID=2876190 RepID=UPI001CCD95AB